MWNDGHYLLATYCPTLLPRCGKWFETASETYSTMRVNLAAQALSLSVAAVLKAFSPPKTAGTAKFWKNSGLLLWLLECTQYTGASEEEKTFPGPIHIHNRSEIWLAGRWIPNIPERVEAEYPGPTRQFYWKCQRQNVPILANIWRDADNNPLCCWS